MMKKNTTLLAVTATLVLTLSGYLGASAQTRVSAEDSLECAKQYSVLSEYMKQRNYDLATPAFRYIWNTCPDQYQGTYIWGNTIYKTLFNQNKDAEYRKGIVDTLMQLHDRRILLSETNAKFGDKGTNIGRKALDLIIFKKNEDDLIFPLLKESFELSGEGVDANVIIQYMFYAERQRAAGKLECSDIIDLYGKASAITEKKFAETQDSNWVKTQVNVDLYSEKCLDCEALLAYYTRTFEANKTNADWLAKASANLDKKQCAKKEAYKKDPVIGQIFLAYAEAAKTADAYIKYASFLIANDKVSESQKYVDEAIKLETDNDKKAQYLMFVARIQADDKKYSQARDNARKALQLRPNWGDPYILIGDMYAASAASCGGDDITVRGAVFSAAVDKYMQAINVDPSSSEKANAQAARCRANYPADTEVFFTEKKAGDVISIGCWIGESATLRVR
ncbi:MAG: hypothetical protein MH137_01530 [Flavobacteriales bacterium]|nr:hypothetical protein [Flavobacteriales bacterium]